MGRLENHVCHPFYTERACIFENARRLKELDLPALN